MQVISVGSTELFVGPATAPLQIVQVAVAGVDEPTALRIDGAGLSGNSVAQPGQAVVEVPVAVRRAAVGQRRAARLQVGSTDTRSSSWWPSRVGRCS